MKKLLILCPALILCLCFLASCGFSFKHEHLKGEWEYDEMHHWQKVTCTWNKCDIDITSESHVYENSVCKVCGYAPFANSTEIAQTVLDYEQSLMDEITKLQTEQPEYNFYYHEVDQVCCYFSLTGELSANDIIVKYDLKNLFANARVSDLNALKMLSIIFDREEFTESVHQKLKQISVDEVAIKDLMVSMERIWNVSYMPKIEYYTDGAIQLNYTTSQAISVGNGKDVILKSKDEYNAYLDELFEMAKYDYQKEKITAARDSYSEAFFEENALIITKILVRGSGSIKLTVDNLYVSNNTVYVVVRTDEPVLGTADILQEHFCFTVAKSDVANVDSVVTLD